MVPEAGVTARVGSMWDLAAAGWPGPAELLAFLESDPPPLRRWAILGLAVPPAALAEAAAFQAGIAARDLGRPLRRPGQAVARPRVDVAAEGLPVTRSLPQEEDAVIHTVALMAEAIRPDGGWVGVGPTPEELWVVLARLGASARARFFRDSEGAMACFLEYANLELGLDGEIQPTTRMVVRRPDAFQPPSREAWRRIGGALMEGGHP
jgi:hypothetical protein